MVSLYRISSQRKLGGLLVVDSKFFSRDVEGVLKKTRRPPHRRPEDLLIQDTKTFPKKSSMSFQRRSEILVTEDQNVFPSNTPNSLRSPKGLLTEDTNVFSYMTRRSCHTCFGGNSRHLHIETPKSLLTEGPEGFLIKEPNSVSQKT